MDRRNFSYDQVVADGDLNGLQTAIEVAAGRVLLDFFFGTRAIANQWGMAGSFGARQSGVLAGCTITAGPGLSVQVGAGVAYDTSSPARRIELPAPITIDCSTDSGDNPTRPSTGLSRQIGIFVRQARIEYDPRIQADGTLENFRSDEGAAVEVWQSADFDPSRGQTPGPLNIPPDGMARVLLATLSISSATTQINSAAIQGAAAQYRPPVGQFGLEGDLPLSIKDAICLIAGKTFGNLEVVPVNLAGPNTTVFINYGWACFGARVVRGGGAFLTLTGPNAGEHTTTVIYLASDGTLGQSRAASTGGDPVGPVVSGSVPLAEIKWDWDGAYGATGFSPFDLLDDRPFLSTSTGAQVTRFRTRIVATAGQQVFDLTQGTGGATVHYIPGNNSLNVFCSPNSLLPGLGGLLDSTLYVETDATHVTLNTAANAGDVYTFEVVLFDGH